MPPKQNRHQWQDFHPKQKPPPATQLGALFFTGSGGDKLFYYKLLAKHWKLKPPYNFVRKEPPTAPDCALRNVNTIILTNTHTCVGVISRGASLFEKKILIISIKKPLGKKDTLCANKKSSSSVLCYSKHLRIS